MDRALLRAVVEKFEGGPVGLSTLAVALGEEPDTIEDVYEPYLLQLGFIQRTPRGRIVTRLGREHIGARGSRRRREPLLDVRALASRRLGPTRRARLADPAADRGLRRRAREAAPRGHRPPRRRDGDVRSISPEPGFGFVTLSPISKTRTESRSGSSPSAPSGASRSASPRSTSRSASRCPNPVNGRRPHRSSRRDLLSKRRSARSRLGVAGEHRLPALVVAVPGLSPCHRADPSRGARGRRASCRPPRRT